ncbi:unnamed protein product, partial [Rotaria magnacalcarata]
KTIELMSKFNELDEEVEEQNINLYEDLQRVDQHASETLIELIVSNTKSF